MISIYRDDKLVVYVPAFINKLLILHAKFSDNSLVTLMKKVNNFNNNFLRFSTLETFLDFFENLSLLTYLNNQPSLSTHKNMFTG